MERMRTHCLLARCRLVHHREGGLCLGVLRGRCRVQPKMVGQLIALARVLSSTYWVES